MATKKTTKKATKVGSFILGLNKETKNTYRFQAAADEESELQTIYIGKRAFSGRHAPVAVRVTVEQIED